MKNYFILLIFILVTFQCSSQEIITISENKNHYYFFKHEVLSYMLPEDWKTKVYFNSLCLNNDKSLSHQFDQTQNALINHFASVINPDEVELFNAIKIRIYLKREDLKVDHLVLVVEQEVVHSIHEEIVYKLIKAALEINFSSISNIDFSSCQNLSDQEWILWRTPLIINGKIMEVS